MNKHVLSFEEIINEAASKESKPKSDLGESVFNNANVNITIIDTADKLGRAQKLMELVVGEYFTRDYHEVFNTMYYNKLITPYFVELKNGYFASMPVVCDVDYNSGMTNGKYKIPQNCTTKDPEKFHTYFDGLHRFDNDYVGILFDKELYRITDFTENDSGRWNFACTLKEPVEVLTDDEAAIINGTIVDITSKYLIVLVHNNGKTYYFTPLMYYRVDPNTFKNEGFIFDYIIKDTIK